MTSITVENITAALEEANINTPAQPNIENDAAHVASAAEGRRLYIGNLAYSATDEQLQEFFKGYSVESTSIPTNARTSRAVGYAFVDLTTKEEAERAISELSGKEVLERKVSVQLARKPGATTPNRKENDSPPHSSGNERKGGRGGSRFRGAGRKFRGGYKGRHPRDTNTDANENESSTATDSPAQLTPLTESTDVDNEASNETATKEGAPAGTEGRGGYRGRKKRGPPEDGVPSKTKVMVANLPYELNEEKLKELFSKYQPESAKIALRSIPHFMVRKLQARGEPRKGRGFGFVSLANEEMQQKAVAEMNGITIEGREIAVKVAIDNPKLEEEAKEAGAVAAAAATGTEQAAIAPQANGANVVEAEVDLDGW